MSEESSKPLWRQPEANGRGPRYDWEHSTGWKTHIMNHRCYAVWHKHVTNVTPFTVARQNFTGWNPVISIHCKKKQCSKKYVQFEKNLDDKLVHLYMLIASYLTAHRFNGISIWHLKVTLSPPWVLELVTSLMGSSFIYGIFHPQN